MVQPDVCIIGAGIMGASTAYYLSRKNPKQKILLLEKYQLMNEYSASNDVNRVFRYAYGKDGFYTSMAVESLKLWKQIERATGEQLLVPSGLLLVQSDNAQWNRFNEESYRTLMKMGLKTETLEKEDLRKRYPQFRADKAYLDPYGAAILASKALKTFIKESVKNGVKLLSEVEATSVRADGQGLEIETRTGETISSEKVVMTTGFWSNPLLRKGLVNVKPTRQQLVYFKPSKLEDYRPGEFPIFFADEYYGIPAAGIDAVKVSNIGRDQPVDPATADRSIDEEEVDACRHVTARFIPSLARAPVAHGKVCLYDMTPDSDFVIGPDPENSKLVYGYGFSGHGFKFAPLIGQVLSEFVLGDEPRVDTSRFNPTRWPTSAQS